MMKRRVRVVSMVLLLNMLIFLSSWSQFLISHGDVGFSLEDYQKLDALTSPEIRKPVAMVNPQYVPNMPIKITNNANFMELGFPGEGTKEPFARGTTLFNRILHSSGNFLVRRKMDSIDLRFEGLYTEHK